MKKTENSEQIPVVNFVYNKQKDIWCILKKGPGGIFNPIWKENPDIEFIWKSIRIKNI